MHWGEATNTRGPKDVGALDGILASFHSRRENGSLRKRVKIRDLIQMARG